MKNTKILFVTWDGAEVNYIENLFAPIFKELQEAYGYEFHIAQFTWASNKTKSNRAAFLNNMGIKYLPININLKYSVLNILIAKYWYTKKVRKYLENEGIGTLMPRAITSYYIIQNLIKEKKYRLIYDADGFPLEERVDFNGLSKKSFRFRYFKEIELNGYQSADAIICRSLKAKNLIESQLGEAGQKSFTVNNGTLNYRLCSKALQNNTSCHFIYSGSLGPQYMLPEMINMFLMVQSNIKHAKLTILTVHEEKARILIQKLVPRINQQITIKSVAPHLVDEELQKADIGISFRKQSYSMQAVAPIKIAEYLGAGLSVLFSPGIGDLDEIIMAKDFAYLYNPESNNIKELTDWVLKQGKQDLRDKITNFAFQEYSLQKTVAVYHQAFQYGI